MTTRLPRLYEFFVPGEVVRHDELAEVLKLSGNSLRKHLWALTRAGDLLAIRRGLYAVQGRGGAHPALCPFAIGSHVTADARLGFETALRFYTGQLPAPGSALSIVSRIRFRNFCYDDRWYFWHERQQDRDGGVEADTPIREVFDSRWGARAIRVATPEWALTELLARPFQIQELADVLKLCAVLEPKPDGRVLVSLCQRLARDALAARLGVVLDLVGISSWPHATLLRQALLAMVPRRQVVWFVRDAGPVLDAWPQLAPVLAFWRVRLLPRNKGS